MSEESKALEETAKAAGKAIELVSEIGGLIAKYTGASIAEAIGIFEDKLKYMRWERQVRLMQRAEEFLLELGLSSPTRNVPMKFAIPLFQAGSLEEDDSLQDIWAALLANAANASFNGEVRTSYISILQELTALDSQILDVIYSVPYDQAKQHGVATHELPRSIKICDANQSYAALPSDSVLISLNNLVRLGCLNPGWLVSGESYSFVSPTIGGKAFVEACRIKQS